jgi:hypothetical protein
MYIKKLLKSKLKTLDVEPSRKSALKFISNSMVFTITDKIFQKTSTPTLSSKKLKFTAILHLSSKFINIILVITKLFLVYNYLP